MDILTKSLLQLAIIIIIFLIVTYIGVFIHNKIKKYLLKNLDPVEFLPEEELSNLKQISYLILMALCFINVLYSLIFIGGDLIYFVVFDFALSLYIAITLDKSSLKNKVLLILLVPYGAMAYMLDHYSLIMLIDFIHIPVFLYFVKFYYDKFVEYTDSNGLRVTITLLFVIIFVSFFITQFVEGVNPLDSLVMVSNAFTSNGYAILGNSIVGKINSLFLVWGGYVISIAGTATLTAALLLKHFNKRVKQLEMIIEDIGDNDG
ncbi:hypothetical protein [uncultured Methanobrevibacter sp.]|uniref:hypothetical protein n=1 Tax=uncultured Methanobrevibacter sp. TaxID=253161 RepID=UPI00262A2A1B|nr:hypothetical protein [uncultured Methanobrevibacter sp.]